jgi:cobalt/nickel transport protein
MRQLFLAMLILAGLATAVQAHFSLLVPGLPWGKKGEAVAFNYLWGHPYEHQLFDAPPPVDATIAGPDGKARSVVKDFEKIQVQGAEGKKVIAYRFLFTPESRGDYTLIVQTPPQWMEEEKEFLQDTVKVVWHVQAQKNWDADFGPPFRMLPLTRPYGLYPGMVFRARVVDRPQQPSGELGAIPQKNLLVFMERLNSAPPKKLPDDEFITFTSRTDANGVLACSFPTAGWWSVTAQRDAGQRMHEGKNYPVRQRVTLWVHVNETK